MMNDIPDESVDLILCDLPFGTTSCAWDTIIPFEKLWEHYKRIIKQYAPIVLFGSQPFTSNLICSNISMFREELVMNSINDLILELTTTCKTPDGISIYKAESYSTPKSLPELFSEVDEICDELSDDKLYNLILLLSSIGESGFENSK